MVSPKMVHHLLIRSHCLRSSNQRYARASSSKGWTTVWWRGLQYTAMWRLFRQKRQSQEWLAVFHARWDCTLPYPSQICTVRCIYIYNIYHSLPGSEPRRPWFGVVRRADKLDSSCLAHLWRTITTTESFWQWCGFNSSDCCNTTVKPNRCCIFWILLRKFLLLENVGAILSAKQRPLMEYMLKDSLFAFSRLPPECPWTAGSREEEPQSDVGHGQRKDGWREGRGPKSILVSRCLVITWMFIKNINFPLSKIWRERVFFLIAEKGFNFFEACVILSFFFEMNLQNGRMFLKPARGTKWCQTTRWRIWLWLPGWSIPTNRRCMSGWHRISQKLTSLGWGC